MSLQTYLSPHTMLAQARGLIPVWLLTYVPGFAILATILMASRLLDVPISDFTRDTVAVVHVPLYTGVLSNFGLLVWCAAVTVSFLGAALLLDVRGARESVLFLFFSGSITSLLLIDDLLLLHEKVYPKLLLPEKLAFAIYGLLFLLCIYRFRIFVLQTDYLLLLVAFIFLGLSIVVDTFPEDWSPIHHLFEDGFKFLGIVGWLSYFTSVVFKQVRQAIRLYPNPARPSPPAPLPILGEGRESI